MCERYSFALSKDKIIRRYGVKVPQVPEPHYNIGPGMAVPVIRDTMPQVLTYATWGVDLKKNKLGRTTKPIAGIEAYRLANRNNAVSILLTQRCLIPADGFYLWRRVSRRSQVPFRVSLKWNLPFAFAGVWQTELDESGTETVTCALITVPANELLAPVAAAMPLILTLEEEKNWFSEPENPFTLQGPLVPYPAESMKIFPVSPRINDRAFNSSLLTQTAQPVDQFGNYILFEDK